MRSLCLVGAGLAYLAAPVPVSSAAAAAAAIQPAHAADAVSRSRANHRLPGDGDLIPSGLWHCMRHPRACLGDPMQPPPEPESNPGL